MADLDLKDWKILFELDLNARQSLQSIGKKVGLSKEVVNYRIKKLQDAGIIKNFFTRIDFSKLGLMVFRTFLRLYNLTPEKEKDITNFIISNPKLIWCGLVDGNWDVNFIYLADSTHEFYDFWLNFLTQFGDYIQDKHVSIADRYIQFPKLFLLDKKLQDVPAFVFGRSEKIEVKEKDVKLLSVLSESARMPTIELAKKTKLSAKSVAQHIKNLKQQKVILGFGVEIDLNKIGFEYFKLHLHFKRFDAKRFNALLEFCRFNPFIIYTNELIGGADLELDINIKNKNDFHQLLNEIRFKFSDIIKDFESLQYFEELKFNPFPRKIDS